MAQRHNDRFSRASSVARHWLHINEQGFTCIHCQQFVTCASLVAGVQNRNHCPCCLWSRHLDWRNAGDRLSTCQAAMEPIGLTTKRGRNKYARERDGELMIVHRCSGCAKLVINRIAADDSAESLLELFEVSWNISADIRANLATSDVLLLTHDDDDLVRRRLLGTRVEYTVVSAGD